MESLPREIFGLEIPLGIPCVLDAEKKRNLSCMLSSSVRTLEISGYDSSRVVDPEEAEAISMIRGMEAAQVGFKCRSVLVKLRKMYLILIEVPHLKHRFKAANLMSLFDCKIGNSDNQVITSMVEHWWATTHTFHLPCGELGITPRDFTVHTGIGFGIGEPMVLDESYTEYGNALRIFPDMKSKDYEKRCISFAHLRTYLDHTRVNIKDAANTNTIFRAFMLLYFGGVLFGNSKSWARLALFGPIAIIEKKGPAIDFGFVILGHLYYCLDQYQSYEYCQIGHHILIDNRLDDFWLRMSDYNAYWRHVSHGALMSEFTRYVNINIPGLGALTAGVTFLHVEFPTEDFSTQKIQIPPPQLGDYPGWIMEFGSPHGTMWHTIPSIATTSTVDVPTGYDFFAMT
ncbi:hypothetical protein GIB67_014929 [Kingdonia uniflora]|uniref:Aminotransferase-like plant mobile domain-containing protein n=1 Tax=Kingdonia uniflora TaxID=39325 RepID=A0A7J7MT99_9MAGN|nr:hypothetical protein GIB67_014929 [Kingdonia uniflora]